MRSLGGVTALGAFPFVRSAVAAPPQQAFNFLFFTDTHIEPELHATDGCRMAFAKRAREEADFAVCGGDLIYDGLAVNRDRAHL